jgi:hypothetical protein
VEQTLTDGFFILTTYDVRLSPPKECLIQECLREIQTLFTGHFDQNWLLLVLDDTPIDSSVMSDIRNLIAFEHPKLYDPQEVQKRIPSLEAFIAHLRRYLLPTLREKLGISGLVPFRRIKDREQRVLRSLIAYAFPHNLERLSELTDTLKAYYLSG